jgi:DNA-binding CsgD family transcriptional regulator/tetratricopeptide (TPR) repeat protein
VNIHLEASGRPARQCERINTCVDGVTVPTIVVINDAHHASRAAIALLCEFAEDLKTRSILVILSVHADLTQPSVHAALADVVEHGASSIEFDRLPASAMRRILRLQFVGEMPLRGDVFERCIRLANGNPQYLKDLSAGLRRAPACIDLRTLSFQLERNLERTAPVVIEIARAASILGDTFEMHPLAFVVGKSLSTTERALQRLCDKGILRFDQPASANDSYSFIEPGTRWVFQRQLSPARREELCRRALSYQSTIDRPWSPSKLAEYHEGANLNAKAFELLITAGHESRADGDFAAAISYFDRATSRASDPDQELHARLRLARALDLYGQDDFAIAEFERVIRLAAGTVPEAELLELCCELRQAEFDLLGDGALSSNVSAVTALLSRESQSALRARLSLLEAQRLKSDRQRQASGVEHTSPVWQLRSHFMGARVAMLEGRLSAAEEELRFARQGAKAAHTPSAWTHTLNIAAENARSLGRFTEQVTLALETYEISTTVGSEAWARVAAGTNLAAALVDAGRIIDAAVVLREIDGQPYGSSIAQALNLGISLLVSILRGGSQPRFDDRVDLLGIALGYGDRSVISYIGTALALASLQNGDVEASQEILHRCIARLPDSTDASLILVLAAQVGSSDTMDLAAARLGSGPLSSIPFNRAVSHLFSAIRARRSRDKVDEVRLAFATQTFERFGCGYLYSIASLASGQEKSAFGLFVGKSAQAVGGRGAIADSVGTEPHLTPRQRLVARLLHHGYSNRRIGDELGIAEGTVAIHVAAILRKYGVKSRMELVTSSEKGA